MHREIGTGSRPWLPRSPPLLAIWLHGYAPKPADGRRWVEVKKIRFRDTGIKSGWNEFPDDSRVRWKNRGNWLRFSKKGSDVYHTEAPVFGGDTISRAVDPNVRPPSINGRLRYRSTPFSRRYLAVPRSGTARSTTRCLSLETRPSRRAQARDCRIVERSRISTKCGPLKFAWWPPRLRLPLGY